MYNAFCIVFQKFHSGFKNFFFFFLIHLTVMKATHHLQRIAAEDNSGHHQGTGIASEDTIGHHQESVWFLNWLVCFFVPCRLGTTSTLKARTYMILDQSNVNGEIAETWGQILVLKIGHLLGSQPPVCINKDPASTSFLCFCDRFFSATVNVVLLMIP